MQNTNFFAVGAKRRSKMPDGVRNLARGSAAGRNTTREIARLPLYVRITLLSRVRCQIIAERRGPPRGRGRASSRLPGPLRGGRAPEVGGNSETRTPRADWRSPVPPRDAPVAPAHALSALPLRRPRPSAIDGYVRAVMRRGRRRSRLPHV